jgi:hypothetical protein
MQAQLAVLQGRVAQLEVELAGRPVAGPVTPTGRLLEAYAALRRERDELADAAQLPPGLVRSER